MCTHTGSLVDGGANGGLAGSDCRVIETSLDTVDVIGIAENILPSLPLGTCAGRCLSTQGPVIVLLHQYALHGGTQSTHSIAQMRAFGLLVDECPRAHGGFQRIVTPEGYILPLAIRGGLPYLDMRYPTDAEMDRLPQVALTADMPWNPYLGDNEFAFEGDRYVDADETLPDEFGIIDGHLTDHGEYFEGLPYIDERVDCLCEKLERFAQKVGLSPHERDFEALRPLFGWVPAERIKKTLEATTQFARNTLVLPFRKHFKTRFPAANVPRLDEVVATDTFFAAEPALDDGVPGHAGVKMVQMYCGKTSQITYAAPMHKESEMPNTLNDFIRKLGAMRGLFSDNARAQTSLRVKDILRHYKIDDMQSEANQQNQNYAERRIGEVKRLTSTIMDRTGTPAGYWLLCLLYAVYLLNHLAVESLEWRTPIQVATGHKPDTSALLVFRFWEPVFYAHEDAFPRTREKSGRWVGVAEHQGDAMTWLILTDDTKRVIARSNVRTATDPSLPNAVLHPVGGEGLLGDPGGPGLLSLAEVLREDTPGIDVPDRMKLPLFTPDDLLGITLLVDTPDGRKMRATVVEKLHEMDATIDNELRFRLKLQDEDAIDDVIAYSTLCDMVEDQMDEELRYGGHRPWSHLSVTDHQGPLIQTDHRYKGSSWNVLMRYEDGSEKWEALGQVCKVSPVLCAVYGKEHGLLDKAGWKRLKKLALSEKKLARMMKQAYLSSERTGPIYKFGVQIPRNMKEAISLDVKNGNTKWQDAVLVEKAQLLEYKTFKDQGYRGRVPVGFQRIHVHFIFDCKHDLRRKARAVANGSQTEPPKDSVYSSVVSLRSLRLAVFLGELNGLGSSAADIGNAYLEALTKEKVYFVAGPEFGELEGHVLIIVKALYGLRTSGARFHERLAVTLRDMGFTPCEADEDVWMRECGDVYEYVCTYVDDLACVLKAPEKFFEELRTKYGYKLKGVGLLKYHLGADFYRDPDGTLVMGAKTYVERMMANYQSMFGELPKPFVSPLEKGDHPELDQSSELEADDIKKFQSLIGAMQWTISLCRMDIACAVMTLGRYRAAPRIGHLDRLKRICGYLRRTPDAAIRFRVGIPDYSNVPRILYDWATSVYGDIEEEIPQNMPVPRGKPVVLTAYFDANLMHDYTTGRSVTGVLHLVNQTPIDWYSKRQATVETATYGSELVAGRTAIEQVMDIRYTLRMMGVPIEGRTFVFGDNMSMIVSTSKPQSVLTKRHNALSYHRVREAVAAGIIWLNHVISANNMADPMSKNLSGQEMWKILKPILFWKGETDRLDVDQIPESGIV
jgi:hypothetical protein